VPELPEVETVRRGLEEHVVEGPSRPSASCTRAPCAGSPPARPSSSPAWKGAPWTALSGGGKYLWLSVDEDALLAHLG